MKIAFDGSAFWETGMTYEEQYDTVARAGYEYINPYNADFPGFWKRPKATKEEVLWHKKAIADAGLKIASHHRLPLAGSGRICSSVRGGLLEEDV